MKKLILTLGVILAIALPFGLATTTSTPIFADAKSEINKGVNATGGQDAPSADSVIKNVINTLLFVVGVASVIVIIVSGIYYVISAGNADTVKKAKNALVYAVVGLVIALLSYTIVNYVVNIF